ncbi:MAG: hypothetical protein LBN07_00105 [Christensenellaceae bacterium]|jgi:Tfp pilus assembly protein PilO|nr:hypothetical protein [Christensenellaceae bacterium]
MLEVILVVMLVYIIMYAPYVKKTLEQLSEKQKTVVGTMTGQWNARPKNAGNQRTPEQQLAAMQKSFKAYLISFCILLPIYIACIILLYPYLF